MIQAEFYLIKSRPLIFIRAPRKKTLTSLFRHCFEWGITVETWFKRVSKFAYGTKNTLSCHFIKINSHFWNIYLKNGWIDQAAGYNDWVDYRYLESSRCSSQWPPYQSLLTRNLSSVYRSNAAPRSELLDDVLSHKLLWWPTKQNMVLLQ